jgi:hypothetical protein
MNLLNESLLKLQLGPATAFDSLAVVPLLARTDTRADYLTLEAAVAQGAARVTEVAQGAVVGEAGGLYCENAGSRDVLYVAPEPRLSVPGARVRPSMLVGPGGRARVAHLPSSGRPVQPHQLDVFDSTEFRLGQFARVFHALPRQVGGVFIINEEPVGLEVFDAPETFSAMFPQLVRSYALDALNAGRGTQRPLGMRCVEAFIAQVVVAAAEKQLGTAATHRANAPHADEVRLQSRRITGGALLARDRVVHLAAFQRHAASNPFDPLH